MPIENISDTARWVAYYRAMETDRPDAHFRDPYARKLAGDVGKEIATSVMGVDGAWAMIVRTQVFDEIIADAVHGKGVDTVLNLAAGLDARPWRMSSLPASLRWIDADLPGILNYKTEMMKDVTPHCRYEAITIDLRDVDRRRALFSQIASESKTTLVVSEGLLIYLASGEVITLAQDLHDQAPFRWWLFDLASPWLLQWMGKRWGKAVAAGNAPFRFGPAENTAFFEPMGWREVSYRGTMTEAQRLHREMPGLWKYKIIGAVLGLIQPAKTKAMEQQMARISGCVLVERK